MSTENKTEENEKQTSEFPEKNLSGQNPQGSSDGQNKQGNLIQQNRQGSLDPGAAWAAENAVHSGEDNAENMKSAGVPGHVVMLLAAGLVILLCLLLLETLSYEVERHKNPDQDGQDYQ